MKLIFFDIDGTLWDNQMQIPDSTVEAVKKLRENGHKCFICSGRARGNIISKRLFSLGFDGVLAACGNHVEMDNQVLYEHLLEPELVDRIIRITRECGMPIVLEGPTDHWISSSGFDQDPYIDYLFEKLGDKAHYLQDYESRMRINKFSADVWETTDYATIRKVLDPDMDFLEHEGTVIEAVPKGTSKATGIKWLCDYLGVPLEDTYAVGDSVNDLDMLQYVGHGIAMGNGTPIAKEAAEFITTDIHADGIRNAMQHYGLI